MHRRLRREDPAYLAAMREAKAMFEAEMAKSAMKGRGRPKAAVAAAAAAAPVVDDDAIDLGDDASLGATGEFKIEVDEPDEDPEGEEHDDAEEAPVARTPARKGGKAVPAKAPARASAARSASARGAPAKAAKKAAPAAKGAKAKPASAAKETRGKKPASGRR